MLPKDENINLINIVLLFWKDKYLILIIIFISIILAIGHLTTTKKVFQTSIKYSVNWAPPSTSKKNVIIDFQNIFFYEENFNEWQNNSILDEKDISSTNLSFEEFSNIEKKNGFVFSRGSPLVDFQDHSITLNISDINKIFLIYDYANFTNKKLQINYSELMEKGIRKLQDNAIDKELIKGHILYDLLSHIIRPEDYSPLYIEPPSFPQKIYPNNKTTLGTTTIIGVIFSFMVVMTKYSVSQFRRSIVKLK
jgi:hypothetical protein